MNKKLYEPIDYNYRIKYLERLIKKSSENLPLHPMYVFELQILKLAKIDFEKEKKDIFEEIEKKFGKGINLFRLSKWKNLKKKYGVD